MRPARQIVFSRGDSQFFQPVTDNLAPVFHTVADIVDDQRLHQDIFQYRAADQRSRTGFETRSGLCAGKPVYPACRCWHNPGRPAPKCPSKGRSSMASMRPSVDFPQPDSPMIPSTSPWRSVRLTSSTALNPLFWLLRKQLRQVPFLTIPLPCIFHLEQYVFHISPSPRSDRLPYAA